jgi:ribulose-phosphate 3-epimerase
MRRVQIAPSILAADFAALGEAVRAVEQGGADLIHVDVMDGHFVPNITVGPDVVKALRRVARVPLDVHLMVTDPDRYLEAFVEAGAAMLSVHVEVLPHLHRTLTHIKKLGAQPGVVLNPSTPVGTLEEVANEVDFVLVMSVNPGFSGQEIIPRSLQKVQAVRALLRAAGSGARIEKRAQFRRVRRRHRGGGFLGLQQPWGSGVGGAGAAGGGSGELLTPS